VSLLLEKLAKTEPVSGRGGLPCGWSIRALLQDKVSLYFSASAPKWCGFFGGRPSLNGE